MAGPRDSSFFSRGLFIQKTDFAGAIQWSSFIGQSSLGLTDIVDLQPYNDGYLLAASNIAQNLVFIELSDQGVPLQMYSMIGQLPFNGGRNNAGVAPAVLRDTTYYFGTHRAMLNGPYEMLLGCLNLGDSWTLGPDACAEQPSVPIEYSSGFDQLLYLPVDTQSIALVASPVTTVWHDIALTRIEYCSNLCPEYCGNGLDDDQDGLVDCCDPDLADQPCCDGFQLLEIGPAGADSLVVCDFQPLLLTASAGYESYTWQDGSTDPTFLVTQPGTYHLTVADDLCGGVQTDTLFVAPGNTLVQSAAELCPGDTLLLFGQAVTAAGIYEQVLPTAFGCDSLTRVEVTLRQVDAPVIQVIASCGTAELLALADGAVAYRWSTGDGGPDLTVTTAATYGLTVTDAAGCTAAASATVALPAEPTLTITEPVIDCAGRYRLAAAGDNGTPPYSYAWSNGDTTASAVDLPAALTGITLTDAAGCTATQNIALPTDPIFELRFPNAIIPSDPENATFAPVATGEVPEGYGLRRLEIYNRWGQLLYAGEGADAAWDATHRGAVVPTGVYVWRARFGCDGAEEERQGDVTVIR